MLTFASSQYPKSSHTKSRLTIGTVEPLEPCLDVASAQACSMLQISGPLSMQVGRPCASHWSKLGCNKSTESNLIAMAPNLIAYYGTTTEYGFLLACSLDPRFLSLSLHTTVRTILHTFKELSRISAWWHGGFFLSCADTPISGGSAAQIWNPRCRHNVESRIPLLPTIEVLPLILSINWLNNVQ